MYAHRDDDARPPAARPPSPDAPYFPTEPWLAAYGAALAENDRLAVTGAGWGLGRRSALLLELTDVPVEGRTVADLPAELRRAVDERLADLDPGTVDAVVRGAPSGVRAAIEAADAPPRAALRATVRDVPLAAAPAHLWDRLRAVLPVDVVALLERFASRLGGDRSLAVWLDVADGRFEDAALVRGREARDHGLVVTGAYETWKRVVSGEADPVKLLVAGDLAVEGEGDLATVLRYSNAVADLAATARRVDGRFLV